MKYYLYDLTLKIYKRIFAVIQKNADGIIEILTIKIGLMSKITAKMREYKGRINIQVKELIGDLDEKFRKHNLNMSCDVIQVAKKHTKLNPKCFKNNASNSLKFAVTADKPKQNNGTLKKPIIFVHSFKAFI